MSPCQQHRWLPHHPAALIESTKHEERDKTVPPTAPRITFLQLTPTPITQDSIQDSNGKQSKVARTRAVSPHVDCSQVTWPEGLHVKQAAKHEEGRGKPCTSFVPMASRGHEQTAEAYGVSSFTGCSKTPQPETRDNLQTPSQGSGPRAVPGAAANCGSCLRRNVVSERERRRRISLSCERLRGLLPHFDGRREDMASVLEMTVHFLQLAHSMAPGWEQLSVSSKQVAQPSQEMWHMWQGDVVQVTLADQMEDSKPEPGIAKASGAARAQDPPCCEMLGMDQKPDTERMSELLERSSSPDEPSSMSPEPSSLSPGLSPWLPHSWQLASPQTSDIISGGLHPVGSLARDTESPGILAEEANLVLTSVPDAKYATGAGSEVMDGTPFLLATNPDWWLGSVEGRGGPTLSMSSPMERAEASFMGDPEPSSQELHAGPLELWGLDFGSPGLALKDEADSIFPDFFPC